MVSGFNESGGPRKDGQKEPPARVGEWVGVIPSEITYLAYYLDLYLDFRGCELL
jgi:hypothetical protein